MAIRKDGYYYNYQLRSYILQFMAIFSGLQVMTGKTDERDGQLITVPIHYGDPDRVVAAMLADNTQNKPIRVPTMSVFVRGLEPDTAHFHGLGTERRESYVPTGGLVPDDIKVVRQRMPLRCVLTMDLYLYASNSDQYFQMIEQIMPLFNPSLTIQTSDGVFDMARLTKVDLTSGPQRDSPYPPAQSRRILQYTLAFSMPIWISTPAEVYKDFVEKIFIRVGAVDTAAVDSYDIIAELDSQGVEYELVQDGSNLKID